MNKLFILSGLILVLFAAGCTGNRTANNSLFELSTKYMNDEKYAEAMIGYRQLEATGIKTPALYTNIGTLYYKSHQLGKALQYFEKGLLIAPLDTVLIYNRDKVLTKLTNTVDANNASFDSSKETFFKTLDILNIIVIIDVLISGLAFLFFLLKPAEQTRFYNTKTFRVVLAVSVGVLLVISIVVKVYESAKYAVVITPDATIYVGPSAQARVVSTVTEGYKMEVTDKFDGWFEIKDFQGKTGWISADKMGQIQ